MAKSMRTCKICGKQYEYCGHCPGKNTIEPWRNLYCSENCREVFSTFDKYASKKITATEAKDKLKILGFNPTKVREIHKAIISEIFENGKEETKQITLTPISEVKVGDSNIIEEPKLSFEKKVPKNFRPKPKFVNDKKKSI